MFYTYIKQYYTFTEKDKNEAVKMLNQFLSVSMICREEGILGLENLETENPYLKKAIELIVDGVDEKIISEIFEKYIIFGNHTSLEVLELLLIKEGAAAVSRGDATNIIYLKLAPFIGIEENQNIYKEFTDNK